MLAVKRTYEPASKSDGLRYLVERLWPRGQRKEELVLDAWLKDVAPSTELRRWYGHEPSRWPEFRRRYFAELDANPAAWEAILKAAQRRPVTLLFSAHDLERNGAVRGGRAVGTSGRVGAEGSEIHAVAARPRKETRRGPVWAGANGVPGSDERQAGRVAQPREAPRQSIALRDYLQRRLSKPSD